MSMLQEVGHFLVPGNDPIQLTFFVIIALLVVVSCGCVMKNARERNWQQNWLHGAAEGEPAGLTAEHGSAAELSQAIATKAEKVAVIMPGMLLIIGLLGTFLGLGLALDKASDILQNSGNSVGAMDSSMQDLMSMMQGLGTKFKTSTWGIIAFILLKVWESLYGFEERRLNWCINKMKEVMNLSQQQRDDAQRQQTIQQQEHRLAASGQIVEALSAQTATLRETFTAQTAALRDEFALQAKRAEESDVLRHQHQLAVLHDIAGINEQSRALLEIYTTSSQENMAALQQAASTMSDASQRVAGSASSLQQVVDTLGTELGSMMQGVSKELSQVVNSMSADFNQNIQQMRTQLAQSSAEMTRTMTAIKDSLSTSISNMDQAFVNNMGQMSQALTETTGEISHSVNNMSAQIDRTMNQVSEETKKSANNLKNAMSEFSDTSLDLNSKVTAMTKFIEKVTAEIQLGLRAVSNSNQHTEMLLKRFGEIAEAQQNLPRVLGEVGEQMSGVQMEARHMRMLLTEKKSEALPTV
ncbi:hypothetical protein LU196_14545 [Pantoea sp. Mb-10]|uniref:methyl-accepting chemotaxis protein n=1 Tax=unclassified Pantoea TaxID=2630326 RepID=UPI001E32839A|nr:MULTISPECIES: methyl-accepting chemotaxis protein [unclassified Pantoea]MCE0491264.1 hypothetical protein [Pantoea sp. Mb-10]MCE0502753.1 hypothetical protein [Pantoea sp. Pb-8]